MSESESLGTYLSCERQIRNISLAELAQVTRIPVRVLEALEREAWSDLPNEVFIKGYLRSIARVIGVPEAQLLCRFTQGRAPSTPPPLPLAKHRPNQGNGLGVAVALVVLVVLFTFALSLITRPRYRSSPVRLSAASVVVSNAANA